MYGTTRFGSAGLPGGLPLALAPNPVRVTLGDVGWTPHPEVWLLVAGLVAMAGPTHMDPGPLLRRFAFLAFAARRVTRLLSRMVAPLAGLLHTRVLQASLNSRNTARPVLRRMLATVMENVSLGVARQFRWWIREDLFRSLDGQVDYRANLAGTQVPALFVAGPRDGLAPPEVVRGAFEAWAGPKAWLCADLAAGFSADYGHGDLIFGRRAPEEIYPPIRAWLVARADRVLRGGSRANAR
jgi:pimeloyl-ACP methyl ester carboxylesterase